MRDRRPGLAAASRDGHLALRRAERQQQLVEFLARAGRLSAPQLAERLGVATRTVQRDVQQLRDAGVPIDARAGRSGGISLAVTTSPAAVDLDVAEAAAILSALATVGPNASESASSAAAKLVASLRPQHPESGS